MIAITVEFEIHSDHIKAFREAVRAQARNSLDRETACRQFDVCEDLEAPHRFFLYELYDDPPAFDAHLASEHFKQFDAQVAPWVTSKKVAIWQVANGHRPEVP
jgi:quinol monooxygenase YgiN